MSDEASVSILAEEQKRAVRLLLAHPFVADSRPDSETFFLVRRHARELQRWFAEQLGYRLVVDSELARLHKRPAPGARLRPVRTQSHSAFDPRRYALLCLVLAALERLEVQTVLSELAEQVALLAASEDGVRRLDLQTYAERQAFVDVVRWLVSLGVLTLADGEDTAFLEGRGDALYDIHSRRLTQLLSVPVPASPPPAPDTLAELSTEVYPDTEDGANRRARHRLMRRLIEEPVLYLADLEEAERAYLTSQRHYLLGQVTAKTGLVVEVRREGLAAVDPDGRLTDLTFPGTGTVSHAALLLAERLAARALDESMLRTVLDSLVERYGHLWSQEYRDDRARLLSEALERLEHMGLIVRRSGNVEPLPAIARYKVEEPTPPAAAEIRS